MGGMSKMRERMIGAGIAVVVAGGAFWGITAANADEASPAEPTEVTIATLTARLDAVEDTLTSHGIKLDAAEGAIYDIFSNYSDIYDRIYALETLAIQQD